MIGLDIGAYSIKAVELQKRGNSFTLVNFRIKERSQEPLLVLLKNFLQEAGFNSKELNISVSGHLVLARLIEVPEMNAEELKNAVRFEVERFTPFNIEDAILDYQIVSKDPPLKKLGVLFAAVKKDFVNNYIDIISQAGFTVRAVDIDGIALTNVFLNAYPEKAQEGYDTAFALLNMGDAILNMSVVYKGIPFVLRDISGAGAELADVITKGLGVSKGEAYQIKHNPPSDKQEALFDMMRPALSRFAREIRLSLGYFENQFSKGIETIYLSGGSSRLFGLKEFLSESLDVKIDLWDPLALITIGENISVKSLEDAKQELAVAVGLAIRDD